MKKITVSTIQPNPAGKTMDYSNSYLSELFKIKVNQIKMLKIRGYDTSSEDELLNYRINKFIEFYSDFATKSKISFKRALNNVYTRIDINGNQETVQVFYPETPKDSVKGPTKIKQDQIKEVIEYLKKTDLKHVILITETVLTPDARKSFNDMPAYWFEHFLYEEMTYIPIDHFLVPKHRLLPEAEVKNLVKRNGKDFNLSNLPEISFQDPIIRYYGGLPGQVVEITRSNLFSDGLVNDYKVYRFVTHVKLLKPK